MIGIDHYLTSERFLDERVEYYPRHTHGGNGRHTYADVEAVRASPEWWAGPRAIIQETWQRYGLPMAVTEAHLASPSDEQIRWLGEMWDGTEQARAEGADVRAVTVWSLLGAYDWNSLLTRWEGCYEPGVFEVRDGRDLRDAARPIRPRADRKSGVCPSRAFATWLVASAKPFPLSACSDVGASRRVPALLVFFALAGHRLVPSRDRLVRHADIDDCQSHLTDVRSVSQQLSRKKQVKAGKRENCLSRRARSRRGGGNESFNQVLYRLRLSLRFRSRHFLCRHRPSARA